jgi:PQQ-dependent catabolism-associated CXXCW motif protein
MIAVVRRVWSLVWIAALVSASPAQAQGAPLFDAQGYRSAAFRAPVDRDPAPAVAITPAQARGLAPGAALFLDVLPAAGARRDGMTGAWALAGPHETIPGALWYPETGRSPPDAVLWRALAARVAAFRQQQPAAPIVVFCRADCWMSWNVARRLALGGIAGVRWLADGIEGWHEAGGSLVAAAPVAVPDP